MSLFHPENYNQIIPFAANTSHVRHESVTHHFAQECRDVKLQTLGVDVDLLVLAVTVGDDDLVLAERLPSRQLSVELTQHHLGAVILVLDIINGRCMTPTVTVL